MDAAVVRFTTAFFDVSKERPNPINPIPGESILLWLTEKLKGRITVTPPDAEDWGWYATAAYGGRDYMLGACALETESDSAREWVLQIVKQRSMTERLLGREKMMEDDECVRLVLEALRTEPAFGEIAVD